MDSFKHRFQATLIAVGTWGSHRQCGSLSVNAFTSLLWNSLGKEAQQVAVWVDKAFCLVSILRHWFRGRASSRGWHL